jgi:hypothetical protein
VRSTRRASRAWRCCCPFVRGYIAKHSAQFLDLGPRDQREHFELPATAESAYVLFPAVDNRIAATHTKPPLRRRFVKSGATGFEPATFRAPSRAAIGVYVSRSVRRVLCVQGRGRSGQIGRCIGYQGGTTGQAHDGHAG